MAEGYQREHRQAFWNGLRWFLLVVIVVSGANPVVTVATGGETGQAILTAVVALTFLIQLSINAMLWPKNVARSWRHPGRSSVPASSRVELLRLAGVEARQQAPL